MGSSYTLVAGVNLKAQNGTLYKGDAYEPIAGELSSFNINSGSLVGPPTAAPLDFTAAASSINTWSTLIAGFGANGTVSLSSSTLTLTGTDPTRNVFNVAAAQLSGNTTVNIVVPNGATAIINVSGATANTTTAQITFNGFTVNANNTDPSVRNLLWNYYQAASLSLQGAMLGRVLAPNAAVTAGYGQFDGQLLASSYNGNTEFHSFDFNGNLNSTTSPSVPEPGPMAISGIGLIAIALIARRRKQQSV